MSREGGDEAQTRHNTGSHVDPRVCSRSHSDFHVLVVHRLAVASGRVRRSLKRACVGVEHAAGRTALCRLRGVRCLDHEAHLVHHVVQPAHPVVLVPKPVRCAWRTAPHRHSLTHTGALCDTRRCSVPSAHAFGQLVVTGLLGSGLFASTHVNVRLSMYPVLNAKSPTTLMTVPSLALVRS